MLCGDISAMIRRILLIASLGALSACQLGRPVTNLPTFTPLPGQGQYVRPAYLNAEIAPRVPPTDVCRSQLYQGLLGRHEGAIFIPGLPGRKRVIKPARLEGFDYQPDDFFYERPPFVQVQEYLPGQVLYAPSISNLQDRLNLGPVIQDRITIELDDEDIVQEVTCG